MRLELRRRGTPSPLFQIVSPLIALGLTVVFGSLLFLAVGKSPAAALHAYFIAPLSEVWSVHELLVKATPLVLIGCGLALAFRSANWNIGAEGQFVIGGIAGAVIPVSFPDLSSPVLLPLVLLCGLAGGAAYAAIPAFLKTRFGANEILTSLMLVYVAALLLDWLVRGPWRDPSGYGFPGTRSFDGSALLPDIVPTGAFGGSAHYGFVLAILAVLVTGIMAGRTLKGFEIAVVGEAPRAGRFAGFSAARTTMFVFLLSGGLAGLAGIVEVTGNVDKLDEKLSLGYGFSAIIVAFLGRLNPYGILAAGLLLALSYLGGEAAQISIGVSDKIAAVFQGMLLFLVLATDTLIHYRIVFHRETEAA